MSYLFILCESVHRQNAELAKLRQDCVRLNRELKERTATQQAEEERRKSLETKLAAVEEQLAQTQVRPDLFTVISSF